MSRKTRSIVSSASFTTVSDLASEVRRRAVRADLPERQSHERGDERGPKPIHALLRRARAARVASQTIGIAQLAQRTAA